jgi:hypothetical protein
MDHRRRSLSSDWPALPYQGWASTASALHLWTQVVGKIRLVQAPWTNHSWHVPLYLSARGLTTSPIPFGGALFELTFDFLDQELVIQSAAGDRRVVPLRSQSVAEFYRAVMDGTRAIGVDVPIYTVPSELADGIPFEEDTEHRDYDPGAATRFWRALLQMDRVFKEFRARFIGKVSPVHFFWGSFDLAVTRFSGRAAPPHPAGIPNFPDWVAREAYSHEVSSSGFWPGGPSSDAVFYSYAYPAPDGFAAAPVRPAEAGWDDQLGEFVLPYEAVRTSTSPDKTLLEFLQSTYEAAADRASWDRDALERVLPPLNRDG